MNDSLSSLWVEKYRPATLEDIVLSKDDREFFESLATKQEIPHLLFSGPPGIGKSSISKVIINNILDCQSLYLNTSDGGGNIDNIRGSVVGFAKSKSIDGNLKVVLLDEIDAASFDSQRALRGILEDCAGTCRFILTCNYLHRTIPALQSRCQLINLNPPLEETVKRVVSILKKENITIPEDQKPLLLNHIKDNLPDLRRIIGDIQKYSVSGILNIRHENCSDFAEQLFKKLQKQDLIQIRKELIENEKRFSNDYGLFLKELFEAIFSSSIDYEKKLNMLMVVSKALESHSTVIDKEINAFSALISLSKAF